MSQFLSSSRWAKVPKPALAFSVIVATLMLVWPMKKIMPLNAFDQPFYIGITHDMLANIAGTLHPGAVRYYDEAGIDIPDSLR